MLSKESNTPWIMQSKCCTHVIHMLKRQQKANTSIAAAETTTKSMIQKHVFTIQGQFRSC